MTGVRHAETADSFVHEGLFYRDPDGLLAGTVPFVTGGLAAGEPVLVAMPGANLRLVRATVGPTDAVRWADMTQAGRNPGRIIPWVLQAFIEQHAGRRVRIIGEPIWAGRSATEYPACAQHEALINMAFAGRDATILCPYDAGRLDADVLADACATHPVLVDDAGRRPSAQYAPAEVVARYNTPLSTPTEPVSALAYRFDSLPAVRRFVTGHGQAVGLDEDRLADLRIAVTELAANSVAHAAGSGVLRVWHTAEHLVCEIQDDGWLADPLAGRLAPATDGIGGRGLVIVQALCDLVRVHSTAAGTTIRLYVRRQA
ncbi:sensor histidine kinase [Micromonospora peucetia]|uniref:Anti-sigma regulatory factor (Ser/Thr protein kinase) n=1 Tax=Micromonospora peucetia TaxID=47871 RepID=A0A1C6W1F7_9ACTN|nr:sensor histidine kinase [Micromonospora peucetia]MCX4391001.1 sensor histidine kinase [Micromonospora peucetia]WSA31931.1 sensor histidine kinase [Micromonospora peucetia]SCL72403.1 Anti-sigma regulatory factor (Ser/Thr protein kinase) [Micromonospora peucetia]